MKVVTIFSWLNFGRPAPLGTGSAAGRTFFVRPLQPVRSVCVSSERFFILLRTISIYLNTHFLWPFFKILCAKKASASGGLRPQNPYRGFALGPHSGTCFPRTSWLANVYSKPLWGEFTPRKKSEIPQIRRDRRTRGTNSWLDDTDKNFGPDLPLLFKLHEIWSVDSQENHKNCCHQMSDFKSKMHQIRFRLGLRPDPAAGD